jgi:hypothetical protein
VGDDDARLQSYGATSTFGSVWATGITRCRHVWTCPCLRICVDCTPIFLSDPGKSTRVVMFQFQTFLYRSPLVQKRTPGFETFKFLQLKTCGSKSSDNHGDSDSSWLAMVRRLKRLLSVFLRRSSWIRQNCLRQVVPGLLLSPPTVSLNSHYQSVLWHWYLYGGVSARWRQEWVSL